MQNIVIIVVNYNQSKTTTVCLDSIAKLKTPVGYTVHTLIVDNGSAQKFKPAKRFNPNRFHLIRSDANLGFTGGNNLGIHYSAEHYNPQYVWLLNNDTTVAPDSLKELVKAFVLNPRFGLISPKIYFTSRKEFHKHSYHSNQRGKVIWFVGGVIDWQHLIAFHKGVDEVDYGQFEGISETDFCTGCSILIKREVLEKIGFLNKRYFLYFEDVDWSLKAKKYGYQLAVCHQAVVWHDNAGSSGGSGSDVQTYYQERNRSLLAWLHGDLKAKLVMLRLQLQALLSGNKYQKKAVIDFYRGNFGKQVII